jgi:tetrathionate reductase subunit A
MKRIPKPTLDPETRFFYLFFGTGFAEANFGPPLLKQLVSDGIVNRGFKFACVDPRLSRYAYSLER